MFRARGMVGNGAKLTASFELSNIPTLHHAVLLTNILNIHFHAPITINGVRRGCKINEQVPSFFPRHQQSYLFAYLYGGASASPPHIEYFTKLTSLYLC